MKFITLVASEVVDGNKVELGRREKFPVPESLEEIITMTEDKTLTEEKLVSCFNYGWKVKTQAELRSGADPKAPSTIFKKAGAANQEKILEMAREAGLL